MAEIAEPGGFGLAAGEEAAVVGEKVSEGDPDRDHEHRGQSPEPGKRGDGPPELLRPASLPEPGPAEQGEDERQPASRPDPERLDQCSGSDRKGHELTRAPWPVAEDRGGERCRQDEQKGSRQLLDPAPEAVAVEQRRLGGEEDDQRPDPG
jgi:hypothetical protein